MSDIQFKFELEKAVEVILYITNRIPSPSFLTVAKLMYFADKTSLEDYGRFICGDTYVAMQHGPVPSSSYDLMKAARDHDQYGFVVEHNHQIKPMRAANIDILSESDTHCLDKVLNAYGHLPTWGIREISHDEAWEKTWIEADQKGSTPIPVERIINTFDRSEDLLEFLLHHHND